MTTRRVIIVAALLGAAFATGPRVRAQRAGAAPSPPATLTIASQLKSQFATVRRLLTKTADKMPAELYSFKPTPAVRSFAGAVAHTAATNFGMCANLTGQPSPVDVKTLEPSIQTKEDAVKALADSFAFCDRFVSAMTDETAAGTYDATRVGPTGERSSIAVARGGLLANLIEHGNEMYGYLAVYLRLKDIVPPSSESSGRGRGGD